MGTELSDICSGRICAGSIPFSGGGTAGVDVADTDHVEYFDVGQVSVAGIFNEDQSDFLYCPDIQRRYV